MFRIKLHKREIEGKHHLLVITCGYNCSNYTHCKYADKCRFKCHYKFHNFSVRLSNFLRYKFNINYHLPIYIQRHNVDLSGTIKCPHSVERNYSCWNCRYCDGLFDGECTNEKRYNLLKAGKFDEVSYPYEEHKSLCKLFEPNDFYYEYDKKTGEYL